MMPAIPQGVVSYRGFRQDGRAVVQMVGPGSRVRELPLRLDLSNHSPTGFEWGFGGSGPAQLALALLAHATGDDRLALRLHQNFKFKVIGRLDRDAEWMLSRDTVRALAREIEAAQAARRQHASVR
jgi:hypothetical protein